jgi:hypothetical protein
MELYALSRGDFRTAPLKLLRDLDLTPSFDNKVLKDPFLVPEPSSQMYIYPYLHERVKLVPYHRSQE